MDSKESYIFKYNNKPKKNISHKSKIKLEIHKNIPTYKDLKNYLTLYNLDFFKKNKISNDFIKGKINLKKRNIKFGNNLQKNNKLKLISKIYNNKNNLNSVNSSKLNIVNNDNNKVNKTYSNEISLSRNDIKNNYYTLESDNEKTIEGLKKNNTSLYSTQYNYEEKNPRFNKEYYSLDDKKIQKRRIKLLKSSYKFNKYNNERTIIQMINKFKNKEVPENVINPSKKANLFCYTKRLPTKVSFGRGSSTNEIKEIQSNFYFNKIIKNQKKKEKDPFQQLNHLFYHGYDTNNEDNIFKNKFLSKGKKSIFIIDSNLEKFSPKDSFGNEIYPVLTKHKILKNILPNEIDFNTKTTIQDTINNETFPLLRFQKKIMTQSTNLISQELNVLFSKYICLSNMSSDKENLYKRHDNLIELKKGDKFLELMNSLITKDKEINHKNKEKINEEEKKKKLIRRNYLFKKFMQNIKDAYRKIKRYKIDIQIFFSLMKIDRSTKEYKKIFREKGLYLFKVIKAGDIREIINVINHNVYLVTFKDEFNQIPLHICAKRNLYEIIPFLLSRLSQINEQDESGRTPLMIAAQNNFIEFVTVLLFECANPKLMDKNDKLASDMTTDEEIHFILKRAEALFNFHQNVEGKNFHKFIYNGLDFLYKKELEINYEKWTYKGLKILKDVSETLNL